jgi:hypothetical protein
MCLFTLGARRIGASLLMVLSVTFAAGCETATTEDSVSNGQDATGDAGVATDDTGVPTDDTGVATDDTSVGTDDTAVAPDTTTDSTGGTDCEPGYRKSGTSCNDINECAANTDNCSANGYCTNTPGMFTCTCNPGYTGDGVTCAKPTVCDKGYADDGSGTCVDIDECTKETDNCDQNADCTNTQGAFTCACAVGYTGDGKICCAAGFKVSGSSCSDLNECAAGSDNCGTNAYCTNTPGTFTCTCNPGYEGDGVSCAKAGECSAGYVKNGAGACVDRDECTEGTATCDANADCTNTQGSFTCACKAGFSGNGKACTNDATGCNSGYEKNSQGQCVDVNECAAGNPCGTGTCTNTAGAYSCTCTKGWFFNQVTCADVNECTSGLSNCGQNASCENSEGSFVCTCNEGFAGDGKVCCGSGYKQSGSSCSDIHECNENLDNCNINANCSNNTGSFTCKCKTGWEGDGVACTDIDECTAGTDTCNNTTTCKNTQGSFTCDCAPGFKQAGTSCFDVDECLDGTDNCTAWCENTPGSFVCMSTVADVNSPYYNETCDPSFSFHQYAWSGTAPNETYEYQTFLTADCRCGGNRQPPGIGGLFICQRPSEVPLGVSFGTGPSVRVLPNSSIIGGTLDSESRMLYVGVEWQDSFYEDQGAILAVDADTGDRTILSGQWMDPSDGYATYGESDPTDKTFWSETIAGAPAYKNPLGRVYDIELGSDGYLYAMTADKDLQTHIVRVDIATGNRKVMWTEKRTLDPNNQNEPAHIQCDNGAVGIGARTWVQLNQEAGFELDANDNYLLPVIQNGTVQDITPNGIIRVAKDGSACTWVTRFGMGDQNGFAGQTLGTGPLAQFSFDSLYMHQGQLYAVPFDLSVYKIDPTTGKRSIVASDVLGTGALVGMDWMDWDTTRQLMWTGGTGGGTTLVSWNMTSGVRFGHMGLKLAKATDFQTASGPLDTCCGNHRPGWVDPLNGNLIMVHNSYGILRFEPESGNSVILSL